jgi:eukaryotic-like serine/threonine-protein kinase
VKPANVFLTHDGAGMLAKVLDFGLSKIAGASRLTVTNGVMGTPAYMSPEQATGTAEVDARTDVYSVGVIVFEALSGRLPFEGDNPYQLLTKLTTQPAPGLETVAPDVPVRVAAVVARALVKDPAQRFSTMEDLASALELAARQAGGDVTAPRTQAAPPEGDVTAPQTQVSLPEPAAGYSRLHPTVPSPASPVRPVTGAQRSHWLASPVTIGGAVLAAVAIGVATARWRSSNSGMPPAAITPPAPLAPPPPPTSAVTVSSPMPQRNSSVMAGSSPAVIERSLTPAPPTPLRSAPESATVTVSSDHLSAPVPPSSAPTPSTPRRHKRRGGTDHPASATNSIDPEPDDSPYAQ